jgi:hypothetical protein
MVLTMRLAPPDPPLFRMCQNEPTPFQRHGHWDSFGVAEEGTP